MSTYRELTDILVARVGVLPSQFGRIGKILGPLHKADGLTAEELNAYIDWYNQDDWRAKHKPLTIVTLIGGLTHSESLSAWLPAFRLGRLLNYQGDPTARYVARPGLFDLNLPADEVITDVLYTCANLPWIAEYWVVQWYRTAGKLMPCGIEVWNDAHSSLQYLPLFIADGERDRRVCFRAVNQMLAHLKLEREWLIEKTSPSSVSLLKSAIPTMLEQISTVGKFRYHEIA